MNERAVCMICRHTQVQPGVVQFQGVMDDKAQAEHACTYSQGRSTVNNQLGIGETLVWIGADDGKIRLTAGVFGCVPLLKLLGRFALRY